MLRIAICDDLPEEREKIRGLLMEVSESYGGVLEVVEYASGGELLSAWKRDGQNIQLFFLDIYMEGIDGVKTARMLREAGCGAGIIFLTTTPDFAVEGYEVEAAGYLLKPLEPERLRRLFERLFRHTNPTVLSLRSGSRVVTILPSDIIYVESNRNRLSVHTVRDTISCYGRLDELAGRLPEKQFLRCHQSYLVNMDRVYEAGEDFHMENGEVVPIRVRERRAIREEYFRFMTEKNL